jgi:hypothetical protein
VVSNEKHIININRHLTEPSKYAPWSPLAETELPFFRIENPKFEESVAPDK